MSIYSRFDSLRRGRGSGPRRLRFSFVLALAITSSSCFGPPKAEVKEALGLARLFVRISPEAQSLNEREYKIAHEIALMIDEAGTESLAKFHERFFHTTEELIGVRDRRIALQTQVRQGVATTALVSAVKDDAIEYFQEMIIRDQGWMQLAENIRLREELERQNNFPEMAVLLKSLQLFTGEVREEPFSSQLQTLEAEYGFTEEDLAQ